MNSEVPSFQRIVMLVAEESKAEMSARVVFAGIYTGFFSPWKPQSGIPRLGAAPGTPRVLRTLHTLPNVFGKLSLIKQASTSIRD